MLDQQYELRSGLSHHSPTSSLLEMERMDSRDSKVSDQRNPQGKPKLRVQGFNFFYGPVQSLFKIDMEIAENEVTAFIGPSGCGKSTLLRCMNRLNDLIEGARHEGNILLDEVDIFHSKIDITDLRKRVGMVFQKSNPFPKSIHENVAYGPRLQGLKNRAVLEDIVEGSLGGPGSGRR